MTETIGTRELIVLDTGEEMFAVPIIKPLIRLDHDRT